MSSRTGVANLALAALAADPIADIDEDSDTARRCRAVLDAVLDRVLEEHPWSFAKARAQLPLVGGAPFNGPWLYRYRLPVDPVCLKLRALEVDESQPQYEIEGTDILCDYAAPLVVVFTRRVDVSLFSPLALDAAGYALAEKVGLAITNSAEMVDRMGRQYDDTLRRARTSSAQQAPAEGGREPGSSFLDARH